MAEEARAEATVGDSATVPGHQMVVAWAASLPSWVGDALRRAYQHGTISQEDETQLLLMAKAAQGLVPDDTTPQTPEPLAADHLSTATAASETFLVTGLKEVQHVNALASDQTLTIAHRGMTVVFGFNGSGKSGYSRLFKRACRAADEEAIHSNIYAAETGDQSATFTVAPAGDPDNILDVTWGPETLPPQLATLAFYDDRCGRLLIDKDNEIGYSPILLQSVEALNGTVGNITESLAEEATTAKSQPVSLQNLIGQRPDTPVATALQKLKPNSTDLTDLQNLRGLNDEQQKELTQTTENGRKLDLEDPAAVIKKEDAAAKAHRTRLDQTVELSEALSQERLDAIKQLITNQRKTSEAAKQVLQALDDCPLEGVGSDPWRALYQAARTYSLEHAYPNQDFPVTEDGSRCVLCQQELTDEGKGRFDSFDTAMKAEAEQLAKAAQEALNEALKSLEDLPARRDFDRWLEELTIQNEELSTSVESWLDDVIAAIAAVQEAASNAEAELPAPVTGLPAKNEVEALIAVHDATAQAARERSDPEGLAKQRAALDAIINDLSARQELDTSWTDVETYADGLARSAKLTAASTTITTQKISLFSTKLAAAMLTQRIEQSVDEELTKLHYTGLRPKIKTSTRGGTPKQGLLFVDQDDRPVRGVRLPDVFSEGEQRVVSLALFLTEIGHAPGSPGIILDDPVSSMDEEWKGRIANRLAQEATRRQVLIFTHSIAFLQALTDACAKYGSPVQTHSVERAGRVAGRVTDGQVWGALNLRKRVAWLTNTIQQAEAIFKRDPGGVEYRALVNLIADRCRATWERVVEEGMFSEAVIRFRKGVETQRIGTTGLAVSPEVFARVHWGMSQMSDITEAHDTTSELGSPLPDPSTMKQWLADLEDVLVLIKAEKKDSQKAMAAAISAPKV